MRIIHNVVLVTFVLGMGALASAFYFQTKQTSYSQAIHDLQARNQRMGEVISKQSEVIKKGESAIRSEPTGSGATSGDSPAAPPPAETSIEFGEIKIKITEDASWHTIAKILTTILGTFLGIRIINSTFRRLDDDYEPIEEKPRRRRS